MLSPARWLCVVAAGPLCRETQLRCPRLAWASPKEEVGYPGAGGGQLPPALFKGQRFSTAGEGQVGVSGQPCPLEHRLPRGGGGPDQRLCVPPLQPSTGGTGGGFVPLEKRGRLPAPDQPSLSRAAALASSPVEPALGQPFCQHSVNTQYCIKAINSHFKETETQFSHQSQEQRLAGLRNVTAQLVAPPTASRPG